MLRLENKGGPGYALGEGSGGGDYPTLVGVSPINNKRAIRFNNAVGSGDEERLHFVDTKALRPGGNDITTFFVGLAEDDTGTYVAGLYGLKGQNDLGTIETSNWLVKDELDGVSGTPAYRAYSKTDLGASADSQGNLTAGSEFDPFYTVTIWRGGFTNFYENGVAKPGDAAIVTRNLDGDGYIGASLAADCATPNNFSKMYFGEFLVYDSELTAAQITSINEWLADKWGF